MHTQYTRGEDLAIQTLSWQAAKSGTFMIRPVRICTRRMSLPDVETRGDG
jgi:hypothetical protein